MTRRKYHPGRRCDECRQERLITVARWKDVPRLQLLCSDCVRRFRRELLPPEPKP